MKAFFYMASGFMVAFAAVSVAAHNKLSLVIFMLIAWIDFLVAESMEEKQ